MGSNIHYVSASQADNNRFGAGVNVAYFLTVGNHAVKGIGVDNNLCKDVGMIIREYSPREHVHTIIGGREHPRISVVGRSKVCFDNIIHKYVMQTRTVFTGAHVSTECHVSGGT